MDPRYKAADLLVKMRAIGIKGTCFDEKRFDTAALYRAETFYNSLAPHGEDYDNNFCGETFLLEVMGQISSICTLDERVQLFVLVAGVLPPSRWHHYLYRIAGVETEHSDRAFLRAFIDCSSNFFTTSVRFIFGRSFSPAFALTVGAGELLDGYNIVTGKRFLGMRQAFRLPMRRRQARLKLREGGFDVLEEKNHGR